MKKLPTKVEFRLVVRPATPDIVSNRQLRRELENVLTRYRAKACITEAKVTRLYGVRRDE